MLFSVILLTARYVDSFKGERKIKPKIFSCKNYIESENKNIAIANIIVETECSLCKKTNINTLPINVNQLEFTYVYNFCFKTLSGRLSEMNFAIAMMMCYKNASF